MTVLLIVALLAVCGLLVVIAYYWRKQKVDELQKTTEYIGPTVSPGNDTPGGPPTAIEDEKYSFVIHPDEWNVYYTNFRAEK